MTFSSLRRWSVRFGVACVVTLVAIQFVPYGRNHVNPPTVEEPRWDTSETRALAKAACFDCHSNETEWPAYAHIAPASWLIHRDVSNGRTALNFSEWQRPQQEATEAAEVLRKQEMPPVFYRLMHAHARLSVQDRARLARGLASTIDNVVDGGEPER